MANLRKLGRRTDHRTAMLRNLVSSLFLNGRITTTVTRAKEAQKMAEKLITEAKKGTLAGNRAVSSTLYSNDAARKVVEEIAPSMKDRNGGYTRVLKMGPRRGDAAEMAILELVTNPVSSKKTEEKETKPAEKKAEEKEAAATPVEAEAPKAEESAEEKEEDKIEESSALEKDVEEEKTEA